MTQRTIWIRSPRVDWTVLSQRHGETAGAADLVDFVQLVAVHVEAENKVFHKSRNLHWGNIGVSDAQFATLIVTEGVDQARSGKDCTMAVSTGDHLDAFSTCEDALSWSYE